jgi:hypothetical protein
VQKNHAPIRRFTAIGTTVAVVGISAGLGLFGIGSASAAEDPGTGTTSTASATPTATASATATPTATATATPTADPAPKVDAAPQITPAPVATPAGTVTFAGTAASFRTLTAETSGWPAGTTFSYRWVRSNAGAVATTPTFVVDPEDVGATLHVEVTGTAPGDTPTTVVSTETAPVVSGGATWGTSSAPLRIDATAGQAVSVPIQAVSGDQGALTYTGTALPGGFSYSSAGVLSGTTTVAGASSFAAHALTSEHPAGTPGVAQTVVLDVHPAAPIGLVIGVTTPRTGPGSDETQPFWTVSADGTTTYQSPGSTTPVDPRTPITSVQGQSLNMFVQTIDRFGNFSGTSDLAVSSSIASDTVALDVTGSPNIASVTFHHASPHVITLTSDGVRNSFTVQVSPAVAAGAQTGTLAFTGSDDGGLAAWGLGLLAAGAAVTVLRVRRRRA